MREGIHLPEEVGELVAEVVELVFLLDVVPLQHPKSGECLRDLSTNCYALQLPDAVLVWIGRCELSRETDGVLVALEAAATSPERRGSLAKHLGVVGPGFVEKPFISHEGNVALVCNNTGYDHFALGVQRQLKSTGRGGSADSKNDANRHPENRGSSHCAPSLARRTSC